MFSLDCILRETITFSCTPCFESRPPDNNPVDDLDKGDDAEAEKEAEESSKRGDEVHRAHPDAPFKF